MASPVALDTRPTSAASAVRARRPAAAKSAKSGKAREQKLGATARSFAILEHVASSHAPVDVLDIIASLKLPKATAYRLVDWFVTHGYLSREPGRRRLLQSLDLRRFTERTITESSKLDAEMRQIRKEQVSFDREEYLTGVFCIAVPVIGKNGEMLAALAIQAPQARMNEQTARKHLPLLRQAAGELAEIFQDRS